MNNILIKLSLAGTINGTRNRHRVATLLIDMGLLDNEKQLIYDHFGHSEQIHKHIYQAPAHKQLQLTGKYLQRLEEASHTKGKHVAAVDTEKMPKSSEKKFIKIFNTQAKGKTKETGDRNILLKG